MGIDEALEYKEKPMMGREEIPDEEMLEEEQREEIEELPKKENLENNDVFK